MCYRSFYVAQRKIFVHIDGNVYELRKIRKYMHQITGSDCFLEGPYNGMGWWEYSLLGEAHFLTVFIIFQIQRENVPSSGKSFQRHFKNILEKLQANAQDIYLKKKTKHKTHSFYIHWLPSLVLSNEDIKISKKWSLSSTTNCKIFVIYHL